jgi:hypothetical protein
MSVQTNLDIDTTPFILLELPRAVRVDNAVILKNTGRSGNLEPYTLMAQVSASGKWVPWTSVTAEDGSATPSGIFLPSDIQGAITEAAIKAADVKDVSILKFGAEFDESKLVIENSLTLETVIEPSDATTLYGGKTARQILLEKSLIPVTAYCYSKAQ